MIYFTLYFYFCLFVLIFILTILNLIVINKDDIKKSFLFKLDMLKMMWRRLQNQNSPNYQNVESFKIANQDSLSKTILSNHSKMLVFQEGHRAGEFGRPPDDCPYKPGELSEIWLVGWKRGNLEKQGKRK